MDIPEETAGEMTGFAQRMWPPPQPTEATQEEMGDDRPNSVPDDEDPGREAFVTISREDDSPTQVDQTNGDNPDEVEDPEDKATKDLLLLKAINVKYLPAFANEENMILNDSVLEAELALKKAEEAVEEQDDRATIMEEHMKRVQQEIYLSQSRHEVKRREIETEEHLWKLSDFESSRLKGEMRKMTKEADEINDRLRAFRTQIFRANEKMDQFRLLMKWNQEELEQWAQAARQKDEDNTAMDKYTKSDNARIRELQLEEMKASEEVYNLKQALDAEVTETQSYQIQLDKTAILFRELHLQRQKVIRLWETTVEAIHKRDESIHEVAEEFADNKIRVQKKKHQLDALQKVLFREMDTNKDLERMIIDAESEVVKVRQVAMKEAESMNAVVEVHELQKVNHLRAQGELAAAIAMKAQAEEEVETKKKKVAAARLRLERAKEKVKVEHDHLDTLEKRSEDLANLLDKEEENYKTAKKEVVELREKHFKATEELHVIKTAEKDTLFEITSGKSQIKTLAHNLNNLEMNMRRQDEVLYTLEFQIQALERKVGRAMGERTDLETKETEKKIADLEKQLNEKKAEEALVISQLKRTQEELRASTRKNEDVIKKLAEMTEKNSEFTLQCDTGLMTVKALQKEKEERMLSHDLLQMEVNRLSDMLNAKADGVFTMESIKQKLLSGMDEQKREMNARRAKTKASLKILNDELHKLMVQRKSLALQIEKLQSKYRTLIDRVKMEDGTERSANYYVIKAAQERQLLELELPKLEEEVDKVRGDVKKLEKATAEIQESNNALRTSLNSPKSIELAHEQKILKEIYDEAKQRTRFKEREEAILLEKLHEAERRLETSERERATVEDVIQDLRKRVNTASREADEQAVKHKRATLQLQKITRDVREKLETAEEMKKVEKELQLVEVRESIKDVLYKLKGLAMDSIEASQVIQEKVAEAGLKFPSTPSSTRSSNSSTASSASSRSSQRGGPSTRRPLAGSILNMDLGLDDL
ncbi:unnamed protein product [Calypogeia fissa]